MTRRNVSDGELAPDGRQIAYIAGENTPAPDQLPAIEIATVDGLAAAPAVRCDIPVARPPAENPTWSQNGASLAWSEQDGIHVTTIAGGTGDCAASPRLIVPGGLHPDWGPYGGPGASSPGFVVQIAQSVTRPTLLRTGIVARVGCTAACRINAVLTVAGARGRPSVLGHARIQLRRAGAATVRIPLPRTARRYATRGTKLQLRVVAQPGGARTYTIRVR